jgi:hypothetical protein
LLNKKLGPTVWEAKISESPRIGKQAALGSKGRDLLPPGTIDDVNIARMREAQHANEKPALEHTHNMWVVQ